ncbi:MAG: hypothetical protein HC773_31275, partial [Scytonema sp. CRU_2_7]|nr:hypothetical protein [Scytonema sp. CRU_2_7]
MQPLHIRRRALNRKFPKTLKLAHDTATAIAPTRKDLETIDPITQPSNLLIRDIRRSLGH